ncbi:hypothetical protein GGI15_003529 [Coemansia interrupta]|uniref:FAM192A/Fyv6 N-terminal domain-containing protein n=1 Tax=Coemansia interrupta TaxID=1126814 RepID=A0A9W8LIK8_9FUNG|nr:hypothetical protein GGI15_003529 [Coemansia interrupta]
MSSSRFISEEDIEEARKEREAAWKKAYESADHDPSSITAPDPAYDPRTLYERLQEQRQRKEEMLAESRRFSSRIRKLDEDETEFLEVAEDREQEKIDEQRRAEMAALAAFREEVAESKGPGITAKRKAAVDESAKSVAARSSILAKIGPVVIKKRKSDGDKERGGDDVAEEKKDDNPLLGLLAAYDSDDNSSSDNDSGSDRDNNSKDGDSKQ